jgi:hypothetical protein
MIFLKFIYYIIYSIGVFIFMYYIDIFYLYNVYKDWLFCDIKNNSKYDYIIGKCLLKLKIFNFTVLMISKVYIIIYYNLN